MESVHQHSDASAAATTFYNPVKRYWCKWSVRSTYLAHAWDIHRRSWMMRFNSVQRDKNRARFSYLVKRVSSVVSATYLNLPARGVFVFRCYCGRARHPRSIFCRAWRVAKREWPDGVRRCCHGGHINVIRCCVGSKARTLCP